MLPNIPFPTMGGKVFWDTIESKNGWKLQRNKITGHGRILDPENIRQAVSFNAESLTHTFQKFSSGY